MMQDPVLQDKLSNKAFNSDSRQNGHDNLKIDIMSDRSENNNFNFESQISPNTLDTMKSGDYVNE